MGANFCEFHAERDEGKFIVWLDLMHYHGIKNCLEDIVIIQGDEGPYHNYC